MARESIQRETIHITRKPGDGNEVITGRAIIGRGKTRREIELPSEAAQTIVNTVEEVEVASKNPLDKHVEGLKKLGIKVEEGGFDARKASQI